MRNSITIGRLFRKLLQVPGSLGPWAGTPLLGGEALALAPAPRSVTAATKRTSGPFGPSGFPGRTSVAGHAAASISGSAYVVCWWSMPGPDVQSAREAPLSGHEAAMVGTPRRPSPYLGPLQDHQTPSNTIQHHPTPSNTIQHPGWLRACTRSLKHVPRLAMRPAWYSPAVVGRYLQGVLGLAAQEYCNPRDGSSIDAFDAEEATPLYFFLDWLIGSCSVLLR
ncbi:hypothetical protein E4U54_004381 [Claviceps lovelessii]|nr:hypothetical protein E4U54_004381 [Claviceps lovelessii]